MGNWSFARVLSLKKDNIFMQQIYSVPLHKCRYIIHITGLLIIQIMIIYLIIRYPRPEPYANTIMFLGMVMLFIFQLLFYIIAKTKITIDDEGITMEHPLRKVQARWDEVLKVKEQVALSQDSGCLVKTKKGRISFYDLLPGYVELVAEIRRSVKMAKKGLDKV